jgi:hypothetical protein
VINNEDTARSFDVSFEVDDWKEIEEYALSGFNIVDDHCQVYQEPAAISTKHPSALPLAIPHKNPSAEPVLTTAVQEHMLTNTNLNSLAIGGKV